MTNLEILIKARELISDPSHWTQKTYARNKYENSCVPTSFWAARFCSIGALYKSVCNNGKQSFYEIEDLVDDLEYFLKQGGKKIYGPEFNNIVEFNDNNSHDKVLKIWDAAIEICEKELPNG